MLKRLPKKDFDYIYSKVTRPCIELVIKTPDGILFTKRTIPPGKGFWHLPGKTILKGMTILDNAKRVAQDELGVEVSIGKLLGVTDWFGSKAIGQPVCLVYLAKIKEGQQIKLNSEASEFGFFKTLPVKIMEEYKAPQYRRIFGF